MNSIDVAYCVSSVICLSVCQTVSLLVTWMSCAKNRRTHKMLFQGLIHVGSRNHVLHRPRSVEFVFPALILLIIINMF